MAPARVAALLGHGAENGMRTRRSSRYLRGRSRRCPRLGRASEIQGFGVQLPRRPELRARRGGSRDCGLPKLGRPPVRRHGASELLGACSDWPGCRSRGPFRPSGAAPLGLLSPGGSGPWAVVSRGRNSVLAAVHVRTAGAETRQIAGAVKARSNAPLSLRGPIREDGRTRGQRHRLARQPHALRAAQSGGGCHGRPAGRCATKQRLRLLDRSRTSRLPLELHARAASTLPPPNPVSTFRNSGQQGAHGFSAGWRPAGPECGWLD